MVRLRGSIYVLILYLICCASILPSIWDSFEDKRIKLTLFLIAQGIALFTFHLFLPRMLPMNRHWKWYRPIIVYSTIHICLVIAFYLAFVKIFDTSHAVKMIFIIIGAIISHSLFYIIYIKLNGESIFSSSKEFRPIFITFQFYMILTICTLCLNLKAFNIG